jgi:glycosyltransferase involved in cell wall biosynthesis
MPYKKKIAFLGTRGIPARYGAFEQAVFKLCEFALQKNLDVELYVGCENALKDMPYEARGIKRIFAYRAQGLGVLLYDFLTSVKVYFAGVRTFVYFGYEFAPFFPFLRMLGVNVICNVDGIEWRRAKWGRIPKQYFRFCEWTAARTATHLIFDAVGIARYYGINHGATGQLIFYGSDPLPDADVSPEFEPESYYSLVMRMEPENNIKQIIEGFRDAATDKILLLIGPSTAFFERECLPLIDGRKIRYLGPIYDRDRLIRLRRNCFAYIHGHSVGGTNPTLIEAIGLGNPIIAYNSIFNREVCGSHAFYFHGPADLTAIISNNQRVAPPAITSAYDWEEVAAAYFALCVLPNQQ